MSRKIMLTLELDGNEAEILISCLNEGANSKEISQKHDVAEILDKVRLDIEEQLG